MTILSRLNIKQIEYKGEQIEVKIPQIECDWSENDGWTFMNAGPQTEWEFTVLKSASLDGLEQLIGNNAFEYHPEVDSKLRKMIEEQQIKYGHLLTQR
jgi:hypothetical protein